jgi:hypothetical protein
MQRLADALPRKRPGSCAELAREVGDWLAIVASSYPFLGLRLLT